MPNTNVGMEGGVGKVQFHGMVEMGGLELPSHRWMYVILFPGHGNPLIVILVKGLSEGGCSHLHTPSEEL